MNFKKGLNNNDGYRFHQKAVKEKETKQERDFWKGWKPKRKCPECGQDFVFDKFRDPEKKVKKGQCNHHKHYWDHYWGNQKSKNPLDLNYLEKKHIESKLKPNEIAVKNNDGIIHILERS